MAKAPPGWAKAYWLDTYVDLETRNIAWKSKPQKKSPRSLLQRLASIFT